MAKRWERLQQLNDVQKRGLIDAPIRVFDLDEQMKSYEILTTNITMLLVLQEEIDDLTNWGYVVNVRRGIREGSPEASSNVEVVISDNLENAREVDIILPQLYLENAAHRGSVGIPLTDQNGFVKDQVDLDKLIEYARKAAKQAEEHLDWLNEEAEKKS